MGAAALQREIDRLRRTFCSPGRTQSARRGARSEGHGQEIGEQNGNHSRPWFLGALGAELMNMGTELLHCNIIIALQQERNARKPGRVGRVESQSHA